MRTTNLLPLAASLAVVAALGCGDSTTTGPGGNPDLSKNGYVRAEMTDDPSSTSASVTGVGPSFSRTGLSSAQGTFAANATVEIQTDAGVWVDLGSPAQVNVAAQSTGSSTTVSGDVLVPVGTYGRVRLTMSNAQAHLLAGSVFGALTLSVDADVTVGGTDGQVVIEYNVQPFTVEAGGSTSTDLVFDLNSESWLTESAVQAGVVSDAALESNSTCHSEKKPHTTDPNA